MSAFLVFIQFLTIFLMFLPLSESVSFYFFGIFFIVLGLTVGALGIKAHPSDNFNIRPNIKDSCVLITSGIYRYIRHPMYFSVIVSMFGVLLLKFSLLESIIYVVLFINMIVKMFYEESLWHCQRDEYKEYAKKTKRLIPYVF
jgi:protein-S-isoprenylcysteine O-methyltransferase Ste14